MKKFAALELGLDDDMLSYRLRQITLLLPDLSKTQIAPVACHADCSLLEFLQCPTLCSFLLITLLAVLSSKGCCRQGPHHLHAIDLHKLHASSLRMRIC